MIVQTTKWLFDIKYTSIRTQALIFIFSSFALCFLADLDGYEGDDLNSVLPMLNLDAALEGLISIYRYDWQPLSYLVGSFIFKTTRNPDLIFLVAPMSIAFALALLYNAMSKISRISIPVFLCLIALTPEIFFTGLYFNSSAPAYACAVASLGVALSPNAFFRPALVGILLGLSTLFRLDFLLISPAIFMVMLLQDKSWKSPLIAALFGLCVGLVAIITGLFSIEGVIDIYRASSAEMVSRAGEGGWDAYRKILVSTTIFSPLGWFFYPAGLVYLAITATPSERFKGVAITISLLPALIPLPNLLSVKYMMPFFVLLPLVGALIWGKLSIALSTKPIWKWLRGGIICITLFLMFSSFEVDNTPPYIRSSVLDARQIGTHDGPRSWGAYASQMLRFRHLDQPTDLQIAGVQIVDALEKVQGLTIAFEGNDSAFGAGAAGWRYTQLQLVRLGYKSEVVGMGLIQIKVRSSQLWLTEDLMSIPVELPPEAVILRASDLNQIEGLEQLPYF